MASTYRIYRSANGTTYSPVGEVASSPFNDTAAALAGSSSFPPISFTTPVPALDVSVLAAHIMNLRNGLNPARGTGGVTFAETITAGTTFIKTSHVNQLRNGVK